MSKTEKTDFVYDTLPYPSMTFPQTHPDHLAAMGKFYGMETASPENCRVLELGCGDGTNLNWLAVTLPGSRFVGVDLSRTHIDGARDDLSELNISNVEFYQKDVLDIEEKTFGKFDFIIAHGLFSWVPDFVREKVLSLYQELLNPNGIAYLSYNALPGCHRRKIVSDAMRFHTRKIDDPLEKVQQGVSFTRFMTENTGHLSTYQDILKYEFEGMADRGESHIFHDDLGDENQAFYFSEIVELAEKNDLQYLSEVERFTSQPHKLPAEVVKKLDDISENIIEYEQYVDFFLSCRFRQTLLCRKEHKLKRNFKPEKIKQFYVSSNLHPVSENVDIAGTTAEKFTSPKGANAETNHPLTKTALLYLYESGTHRIKFTELIDRSHKLLAENNFASKDREKESDITASLFFQIHSLSSIRFHIGRSRAEKNVGEKPKVSEFNRLQAKRDQDVTTFHGLNLSLGDEFMKELLSLLDGSRNLEGLTSELIEIFYADLSTESKSEIREQISEQINRHLDQLAKFGLLV
jgi:methyltransferase-like protein/ubiquinone/menaquinone biosynthesis C-methylase UbiE